LISSFINPREEAGGHAGLSKAAVLRSVLPCVMKSTGPPAAFI